MINAFHILTRNTYAERSRGARVSGGQNAVHRVYRGALFLTLSLLVIGWSSPLTAQTTVNYTADSTMSDAMVANGGVENSNFGSQNQIDVYHMVGQQIPMVFRTFIQYDLTAIPENAIITEAKLKLVTKSVNNSVSHPIYIERVENTSWSEGSITWNNQPDVITADQLSFSHSQTSASGTHEFDVTSHVQHMVNNPSLNNGWRIRLQQETASADFGIMYNSSEANNATKRPVLTIEYILPIEMDPSVVHCTAGNNDGSFSIDVSGGSTYALSNMSFYKTNRDLAQRGKATLQNYKTTGNLAYDAANGTVTASNLEPGIYILRILDAEYYASSDLRFAFYKHILVGREGETTSGILLPNYQYQENVTIQYDKPTNSNPLDRANTNYHSNASSIPLRVADAPNNYEYASLIKYNVDFDDQLEFSKAELQMMAWSSFFRHNNSSNATTYSRVTENWEESTVTWNTRPTVDPLASFTIPATTVIGYDNTHKWDTVSVLDFVTYWQAHPDENFGFEIALETYGATQYAQRSYRSANNNLNYIQFDFTVKEAVTTTFNDTINKGTLIVNAPAGALPYTYLIDTEPLGTLSDAWDKIKGATVVDSLTFFTGDVGATTHVFEALPAGKYYVGVYDNNGTKILDGNGVVNTSIDIVSDVDVDFSNNTLTQSQGAQNNGSARLFAELLDAENGGGVSFVVAATGKFYAGFNKSSDVVATAVADFEFGIKVNAGGAYQVIENNVPLVSAGSVSLGDKIDILRDHADYVLFINETEVYRDPIANLSGENAAFDFVMADGAVAVEVTNYWVAFNKPGVASKIDYPECGESSGEVTVLTGIYTSIVSATLVNNHDATSVSGTAVGGAYLFEEVPIGSYTLTTSYTVSPPPGEGDAYSYMTTEQVAVGYVVEWENMVNNYVTPLNTIRKGPGPGVPFGWATANSTNTTYYGYLNWLQFEVDLPAGYLGVSGAVENLSFRNQESEVAYSLETSFFGSSVVYNAGADVLGYSLITPPIGVWRIDQEEEGFELFKEGSSVIDITTSGVEPQYEIAIQQNGTAQYIKSIASFCSNYPIADQYVEPKREIEGGYFLVPSDDVLRFEFNEEYTIGLNLNYVVRDFTGSPQAGLADMAEVYGDNRFELDVSSLTSGVYVMEIINDKGENWFVRFKVQ